MTNSEITDAARVLWDWLPYQDTPQPADIIFVFGNKSDALPDVAFSLFQRRLASKILLSGGFGRLTKDDDISEAERYSIRLTELGVPREALLLEDRSRNTGENIAFSKALLAENNQIIRTGLAVTTPVMGRRHKASLEKAWPEVKWFIQTPPPIPLKDRLIEVGADDFLAYMAGEVDRLEKYPDLGFMARVEIPKAVLTAKAVLKRGGYIKYAVESPPKLLL